MSEEKNEVEVPEAFRLVMRLGVLAGASPLTKYTNCWEFSVNEDWAFAMNGHREEKETSLTDKRKVPKMTCLVFWRKHQAGILNPFDGKFATAPENADVDISEEAFVRALKTKIAELEIAKADPTARLAFAKTN